MALPLVLPATLTAGTPQNVNDLNSNLSAIVTQYNAAPPQCVVAQSSAQTITNNTYTAVTFDAETVDTDTMHSTVSNTSRITFTTAGVYVCTALITFTGTATGVRDVIWSTAGNVANRVTQQRSDDFGGNTVFLNVTAIIKATAGSFAEVYAYQNSGGSINLVTTGNQTNASAVRIGT